VSPNRSSSSVSTVAGGSVSVTSSAEGQVLVV
jgi:hypothetical protein